MPYLDLAAVAARLPKDEMLRCPHGPKRICGAIAQLGERFNGIEEVVGSIPSGSTKFLSSLKFETTSAAQINAVCGRGVRRAIYSQIIIYEIWSLTLICLLTHDARDLA